MRIHIPLAILLYIALAVAITLTTGCSRLGILPPPSQQERNDDA